MILVTCRQMGVLIAESVSMLQKKQIMSTSLIILCIFACEKCINVTKKVDKYEDSERQVPQPDYCKEG